MFALEFESLWMIVGDIVHNYIFGKCHPEYINMYDEMVIFEKDYCLYCVFVLSVPEESSTKFKVRSFQCGVVLISPHKKVCFMSKHDFFQQLPYSTDKYCPVMCFPSSVKLAHQLLF